MTWRGRSLPHEALLFKPAPDPTYAGLDSFTYKIDNGYSSDTATVWVSVDAGPLDTDIAVTDSQFKPLKGNGFDVLFGKSKTKPKGTFQNTDPASFLYAYTISNTTGTPINQANGS